MYEYVHLLAQCSQRIIDNPLVLSKFFEWVNPFIAYRSPMKQILLKMKFSKKTGVTPRSQRESRRTGILMVEPRPLIHRLLSPLLVFPWRSLESENEGCIFHLFTSDILNIIIYSSESKNKIKFKSCRNQKGLPSWLSSWLSW